MQAELFTPASGGPLLLCVSEPHRAPERWSPLRQRLLDNGYAVCMIALTPPAPAGHEQAWLELLPAFSRIFDAALARGLDTANVFAAGEGVAGSLALHLAVHDTRVQGVIVLSPALEAEGVQAASALTQLKDCPVLLLSAENDTYGSSSAEALKSLAPGFSELRRFAGSAYGADILSAAPLSGAQALAWLELIVKGARSSSKVTP